MLQSSLELYGPDWPEVKRFCSFGIVTPLIASFVAEGLGAAGLGGALAGTAAAPGLLATGAAGVLEGAGIGAGLGAITGTGAGKGALAGGITGGALGGVAPAVSGALGGGTAATLAADVGTGAAAGALGGELTGQSPLKGALGGAGAGALTGLTGAAAPSSPGQTATITNTPTTGGAPSSAAGVGSPATATPTSMLGDISGGGNVPATTALLSAEQPAATGATNLLPPSSAPAVSAGSTPSTLIGNAPLGADTAAATTAGVTGAAAGGGGGISGLIDKALAQVAENPLALLAGGGILAESMMQKPISQTPEAQPLLQSAAQTGATGANLASYLPTGTLPPGLKAAVDNATQASKAAIRSNFASMGLGGSSMEAQQLGAADRQAAIDTARIGTDLLAQGANYTNISDKIYQDILNTTLQQDQAFQKALGTFAAGLAGAGNKSTSVV